MQSTTTATESIDIVRVFYYRYPTWGLLARATRDYQRCFGVKQVLANHVSLQLGTKVYEVSLEGTSCVNFDESILSDVNMVAFYECDIKHIDNQVKAAARFALDYDVLCDRKLKRQECMRYLFQWLRSSYKAPAFEYQLDFNLSPGTVDKRKFHLPYTCASQVSYAFARLFGLEPILDSHLPTALLWMNLAMADNGIGYLYEAID